MDNEIKAKFIGVRVEAEMLLVLEAIHLSRGVSYSEIIRRAIKFYCDSLIKEDNNNFIGLST